MKKITFILAVNLFVALLLIFLSELMIRVLYPEIKFPGTQSSLIENDVYYSSPGLIPESSGLSNGLIKTVDKNGFWKYSIANEDSAKKILFLGDSITMGIGVESDSTFAGILNNDLNAISVLNPSLIGYSSEDYLNVVTTLISDQKNEPGISQVFLFWCLNDVYNSSIAIASPGFNSTGLVDRLIAFLRKNSKLYHFLKSATTDRPEAYYLFDEQFYDPDNENFRASIDNLVQIKSILDSSNVDLKIMLLPYEYQLRESTDDLLSPQEALKSFLEDKSIYVRDITEDLRKNSIDSKDLYLFGDGIHFSNDGHKSIGKILSSEITN